MDTIDGYCGCKQVLKGKLQAHPAVAEPCINSVRFKAEAALLKIRSCFRAIFYKHWP